MPFTGFVETLRAKGVNVGMGEVLEFHRGLEKGLVNDLYELMVFARLVFVKKPEQFDLFERAFAWYFYGIELPPVAEGDPELLNTKEFAAWLREAIRRGDMPPHAMWTMSRDELMRRFWETVREQMEAHHGGSRWVGTGGNSPFGHSGNAERGVRVHGQGRGRSALKVIGDRRYAVLDAQRGLQGDTIRQVLGSLRHMVPEGARDELDMEATIRKTAANAGDIELVFRRQKVDRLKLVVLIDNGGTSMLPWIPVVSQLFSKIKDRFQDLFTYYFHNTIYDRVYVDVTRRTPHTVEKLLQLPKTTRVFIVGDAAMAPEELVDPYGGITWEAENPEPSLYYLSRIREQFPFSVWLNPLPKDIWSQDRGAWTIDRIGRIFPMFDLSLGGIKEAVSHIEHAGQT